jgi:hypothetical protein
MLDETLPIKYKPKAPKKGEIQGTKWKDPHPGRQKNHLRGRTTRGTSSSRPPSNHALCMSTTIFPCMQREVFICLSQEGSLPLFTVFNTMQQCCLLSVEPTLFVEQQSALVSNKICFPLWGSQKILHQLQNHVLGFIPFEAH